MSERDFGIALMLLLLSMIPVLLIVAVVMTLSRGDRRSWWMSPTLWWVALACLTGAVFLNSLPFLVASVIVFPAFWMKGRLHRDT
jgi:hypothetical protein